MKQCSNLLLQDKIFKCRMNHRMNFFTCKITSDFAQNANRSEN